jgi:predicted AAA+ superfamily ATPase
MYLRRSIDGELENWKNSVHRKPLLLRGARQVGKSSSVRNLAQKFEYFVEINFDENPKYGTVFGNGLTPIEIVEQLSVVANVPIIAGKTLLFFD